MPELEAATPESTSRTCGSAARALGVSTRESEGSTPSRFTPRKVSYRWAVSVQCSYCDATLTAWSQPDEPYKAGIPNARYDLLEDSGWYVTRALRPQRDPWHHFLAPEFYAFCPDHRKTYSAWLREKEKWDQERREAAKARRAYQKKGTATFCQSALNWFMKQWVGRNPPPKKPWETK